MNATWIIRRYQDASNFYALLLYGTGSTTAHICKVMGGTPSDLTSALVLTAANDVWKFELIGSTLKGYQNSTERLSVTDSEITDAGLVGLGWGALRNGGDDINTAWDCTTFVLSDLTTSSLDPLSWAVPPCRSTADVGCALAGRRR
jgi:hypothetical protein